MLAELGSIVKGQETMTRHYCLLCEQAFQNKRAWFLHAYHKHSYLSMAGQAAQGTSCPVCAKEYFCREKLKHHFQYSAVCRNFAWKARGPPITSQTQAHSLMPWTYCEQMPVCHDDDTNRDDEGLKHDLDAELRRFVVSVDHPSFEADLYHRIRDTCNRPMPFPDIVKVFGQWLQDLGPSADPALLKVGSRITGEFAAIEGWVLAGLEKNIENEQDRRDVTCSQIPTHRPRKAFRDRYFFHLFSGRRRPGDLQDALELLEPEPGTTLWVLSVDVMVSSKYCNLLQEDTQQLWLRLARDGLAEGMLAGPPCETWSVAREADGMSPKKGPRPLRTAEAPWGLLDLVPREFQQLDVGNRLMLFALKVCLVQAAQGKFSLLEHPDDPRSFDPSKTRSPSIWNTALLGWLRQTGLFVELQLEQGLFHQTSPKPTRFLLSGLTSEVARKIEFSCRTSTRPMVASIGRDGGSFKTAKLKEYTPQLCTMIAQLFFHRSKRLVEELEDAPDDLRWLRSLSVTTFEHETHGPDFARTD